ncbi:RRXRR domain-containing protein [Candidatus Woesearchaeota archaeon]|nr:RRXRR domain-containing protein [Candidatus Woesearchaeota archaeon]
MPDIEEEKMRKTTTQQLQEPEYTPRVFSNSEELLNSKSLENNSNPVDNSMQLGHLRSGNNYNKDESFCVSPEYLGNNRRLFVVSCFGKPLMPCKPQKARKLICGKVAKPVWNKFGLMGIQLLFPTAEHIQKSVFAIDGGTKFEGVSLIIGKENLLNVMWLLPNKKTITHKKEKQRELRRARRWRNCRRRQARFDNRVRSPNWIAPSQLVIVNSRLKLIKEFFKCYPITYVGFEDVKFNHRDNRWGKNFSTIEIGKTKIKNYLKGFVGENIIYFNGSETQNIRKKLHLPKVSDKSAQKFSSHCVDSFCMGVDIIGDYSIVPNRSIIIVDDTYRPQRRKLFDTEPASGNYLKKLKRSYVNGTFSGKIKQGGYFAKYTQGNFKGIRKGSMSNVGQIIGGTKNTLYIKDFDEMTNSKGKKVLQKPVNLKKIMWYSKQFKTKFIGGENSSN